PAGVPALATLAAVFIRPPREKERLGSRSSRCVPGHGVARAGTPTDTRLLGWHSSNHRFLRHICTGVVLLGYPVSMSPSSTDAGSFQVDGEAGERLDRALLERLPGLSRAAVQRLIERAHVRVGGKVERAGYRLRRGDRVEWQAPP